MLVPAMALTLPLAPARGIRAFLAAAACLLSPALAHAYGDTLTVIWKPLPNLPAFAQPGTSFRVWANAPSTSTGWNALLRLGGLAYPLSPAGGGWQPTRLRWEMDFQVPAGTPEELYDFELSCDACAVDVARHAVQVVEDYPASFYFAQVTDTHLPAHPFSSNGGFNPSDTTGMGDWSAVIADLNLIRPAFTLHTGDLVNEGELEEYLGMYEMARAQESFSRLRDPIFVVPGNHDLGGWIPTPPPAGTARRNWWRQFGWPNLENPPAGDPHHSQDYSFDYGLLHVVGLETYENYGSYDGYRTDLWGLQSFTTEQMSWLASDLAAVPPGRSKLLFYHYDFGGTVGGSRGPAGSQINPAALGVNGAIYGHNHGIAEGNRAAQPFNLGLQAVIDGRRTFRIFRVQNGVITPGPMHRAGTTTDSLRVTFAGPNDGSRTRLTANITNLFGEPWEHGRLVFYLAGIDSISTYTVVGGTLVRVIRDGFRAIVYVDVSIPASGTLRVDVDPLATNGVPDPSAGLELAPPAPNPFLPSRGPLTIGFALPAAMPASLEIFDLGGRRVATLFSGDAPAGPRSFDWNGISTGGDAVRPGIFVARLVTPLGERRRTFAVAR